MFSGAFSPHTRQVGLCSVVCLVPTYEPGRSVFRPHTRQVGLCSVVCLVHTHETVGLCSAVCLVHTHETGMSVFSGVFSLHTRDR